MVKNVLKEITKDKAEKLGFKFSPVNDCYTLKFPVYTTKDNKPIIFCNIEIDCKTGEVSLNIYDDNNILYSPYYNREYGRSKVVRTIDRNIKKQLKKFGE